MLETEGAGPSKRPTRPSNTRVISNSRRNLPGAFGDDSDEDEERPAPQEEARAKKPRLSYAETPQDPEEQARKEREREAVKRRLEVNKARRRSSAGVKGRASIGKREWQLSAYFSSPFYSSLCSCTEGQTLSLRILLSREVRRYQRLEPREDSCPGAAI